ncbi:DUF4221 family protein [Algoriphagus kandeliae]|uniref:DUF4221 family protein n=1 Tax=Algoriphagus kandeliae TaxID=2562278 RepID=UPI00138700EE|nr:DUF4221 family protein [Algoriphagus kandeliae]
MKRLISLISLPLILSCGGNSSEKSDSDKILENFSFSVDTILIDPSDKIINLSYGIGNATLGPERQFLYQFDPSKPQINQINLNSFKLENQYPFEEEGPNGIAPLIFGMQFLDNGQLILGGYGAQYGVFTLQGKKVQELNLNPADYKGLEALEITDLGLRFTFSKDGRFGSVLKRIGESNSSELIVFDLETMTGKVFWLPEMEQAFDYSLEFQAGNRIRFVGDGIWLNQIENGVLVGNSTNNKLYQYEFDTDSLKLMEYDFSLVPNQKERPIKKEVNSLEEYLVEEEIALSQIYFGSLIYDDSSNRFFRFGRILEPKKDGEQTRKGDIFLFMFDQNFRLLGEAKMEGIYSIPQSAFFKDGKLWSYVNVDDELGFAIFDFKF